MFLFEPSNKALLLYKLHYHHRRTSLDISAPDYYRFRGIHDPTGESCHTQGHARINMNCHNIKNPDDLLLFAAGRGYQLHQALFGSNQNTVLLEFTNDECYLPAFSDVLQKASTGMLGRWICLPEGKPCEPDASHLKVPKVVISQGFDYKSSSFKEHSAQISFVYVVQGVNGMGKAKVVLASTTLEAASGMMQEAMNGYSIVFSAAVHKQVASLVFRPSETSFCNSAFEFHRVN